MNLRRSQPRGEVEVVGTVTDTRGRTAQIKKTISVLAWTAPQITGLIIERALSNGTADPNGTYLRVTLAAAVSSLLVDDEQKNYLTYLTDARARGLTVWNDVGSATHPTLTMNLSYVVGTGQFLESLAYEIRVAVADRFSTTFGRTDVPVAAVALDVGEATVGVGKFWERGTLDVAGEIYHRNGSLLEPVGLIAEYGGATAPTGWLLCDGAAISRTTYAALFAVIGVNYGPGNGTSTFNLPNRKGKVGVGFDASQAEFAALGKSGGAKTHTLTVNEMPSHQHSIPGRTVDQDIGYGQNSPINGNGQNSSAKATGFAGGGQAHNNLPPYLVVNHIIKAI